MLANITSKFRNCTCSVRKYSVVSLSSTENRINVEPRELAFPPKYQEPRQVWLESLDTIDDKKLGILELHPDVFATNPRIDIIHQNVRWQSLYRYVSYAHTKSRFEVRGGGRKPWPQKGLGRARHGSIRSPLWRGGGVVHGPKSPTPHFYMIPFYTRLLGLTSALSVKFAQDDLHVVDSLDLPTDEQSYIEELVKSRFWGPSVLFVDVEDVMSRNITVATDEVKHFNLMPSYGLNVYSMMKHDTLVLTRAAVDHIENKLLEHLHKNDTRAVMSKYKLDQK
ncbi:39S ribosomal protein L4, mitochondrial [Diabrotica virgifera virgifera]|uniref:Large ribosomal subunit protein uL4m n=1 Tax=Diabrotica virgifera virgifera TaxID=50390 RepID=A0ABM5JRD7_DIAVI|nr:39S ribosomal protein L4, mitochondrial [Diabrotica virgifera virgifera]